MLWKRRLFSLEFLSMSYWSWGGVVKITWEGVPFCRGCGAMWGCVRRGDNWEATSDIVGSQKEFFSLGQKCLPDSYTYVDKFEWWVHRVISKQNLSFGRQNRHLVSTFFLWYFAIPYRIAFNSQQLVSFLPYLMSLPPPVLCVKCECLH